jgi:hypothetical protein
MGKSTINGHYIHVIPESELLGQRKKNDQDHELLDESHAMFATHTMRFK